MRNLATSIAVLGLTVGAAHADPLSGAYDVKFEQIGTTCERPLDYQPQVIRIEVKDGALRVDIARTPLMVGKPTRNGQFSAKSRPGHTYMEGLDGEFRVAGRITDEGMLSLTMIGEYQSAGKPLCTQSWNLAGLRTRADKPKDKPADKPKTDKPKR
jgi:hypothetical protein